MKKEYHKPEMYSEDVSIAFAQTCCDGRPVPSGINQMAGAFCAACKINYIYEYIQC